MSDVSTQKPQALSVWEFLPKELLAIDEIPFGKVEASADYLEREMGLDEIEARRQKGEDFISFKARCIEEDLPRLFNQVLERYKPYLEKHPDLIRRSAPDGLKQSVEIPWSLIDLSKGCTEKIRYQLITKRELILIVRQKDGKTFEWEKIKQ